MLNFNIKYMNDDVPRLHRYKGNCWDVTADEIIVNGENVTNNEEISYNAGDVVFIKFGFAIDMTDRKGEFTQYMGYVYPRSSTFKNYGLILTNHCGIIDHEYKGDGDVWCGMWYALKPGTIKRHERVAQIEFRTISESVDFTEVETLGNDDRGSYGSTGK